MYAEPKGEQGQVAPRVGGERRGCRLEQCARPSTWEGGAELTQGGGEGVRPASPEEGSPDRRLELSPGLGCARGKEQEVRSGGKGHILGGEGPVSHLAFFLGESRGPWSF